LSCSEPFGQAGGPVTAEEGEEGTGVGGATGVAVLEALAELDDVVDELDADEQAATAARQSSAAAAREETAANDRPVRTDSPGPVRGFRVAERSRGGNTHVPPICAAPTCAVPHIMTVRQARRWAPR